MDELSGVRILQSELEKSKGRLKGFNESIKKLTGSDHPAGAARRLGNDFQTTGQRGRRNLGVDSQDNESFSGRMGRGRGRIFGLAKRGLMDDTGPPVKRRVVGGAFSRLGPAPTQRRVREESPEEEGLPKGLSVHSSVVATSREAKNRQDIMLEQTKDKEGMQRNRRMFGLLLGTLNKFKTDSKTIEPKEEQRKKIDKKLEENAENEKKKFKQETMQLMEERHLEETRISKLEQKMEVVQEHADIEREMKKLKCFLCTKTKPRIFWKPKEMNQAAENKLKDTAKVVNEMLRTSQDRLEKEIKDVMEREQKREERIKMRLREDGLFLDEENKNENNPKGISTESKVREAGDADSVDESNGRSEGHVKSKRRVVVEECRDIDSGSESENGEEIVKEELDVTQQNEEDEADNSKTGNESGGDADTDDSGSDSDKEKGRDKIAQIELPSDTTDKNTKSITSKKNENSDDEEDIPMPRDKESKSTRVVEYRESSKEKERPSRHVSKANKSESSSRDRHREERHSQREERHKRKEEKSSRRSEKRSRKDSEKTIVKEEREEKEKKKHRPARTVVEES